MYACKKHIKFVKNKSNRIKKVSPMDEKALKVRMEKSIDAYKSDLGGLRTGRASSDLLAPVTVKAYGQEMPLNQVGNISVGDARLLVVQVWDKGMVESVEKAIRESGLGLNPVTEGSTVRIPLPELTEDRRKELIKVARQYAENARVSIRNIRRDAMDEIKKDQKEGDISEDDARRFSDKVQSITDEKIAVVDTMLETKEEDVMKV